MHDPVAATSVYLEVGKKRVFACAIEWPGWCRSGRTDEAALDALVQYAPRYAAAVPGFEQGGLQVVERVPGNSTTDFGAPDVVREADWAPLADEEAARSVAVLVAAGQAFDRAVAAAPAVLPKGPRGGGRDRADIVDHVREANRSFARKLGVRHLPGTPLDETLTAVTELLRAGGGSTGAWPARYAVRRMAWHVLDHTWELEDKS